MKVMNIKKRDREMIEKIEFEKVLLEVLEKLGVITPEERYVIFRYFIKKESLKEISESLNVSEIYVKEIKNIAFQKIKSFASEKWERNIKETLEKIKKRIEEMFLIIAGDRIENLWLDPKATFCLKSAGIFSITQLASKREEELLRIKGLGMRHIREIKHKLALLRN
jgi:DNA-directed RNA polymerase alpha subunit